MTTGTKVDYLKKVENQCGGGLGVNYLKDIDVSGNCNGDGNVGVHGNGKFGCDDSSYEILCGSVEVIADDHADKGFQNGVRTTECSGLGTSRIVLGSAIGKDAEGEVVKEEVNLIKGSTVDVRLRLQINGLSQESVNVHLGMSTGEIGTVFTRTYDVEKGIGLANMAVETNDLHSGGIINSDSNLIPTESSQVIAFESECTHQPPEESLITTSEVNVEAETDEAGGMIKFENGNRSEFFPYPCENQKSEGTMIGLVTGSDDNQGLVVISSKVAYVEASDYEEKLDLTELGETQVSRMKDGEPPLSDIVGKKTKSEEQVKDNSESLIENTESVELDANLQNLNENVEVIDDNEEPQVVVMDDIQNVLCPEDEAAQSANEAEKPLEIETINDPITKESTVSQFVEVSIDKTDLDIQLKGSAESIEVWPATESLKSEHKNGEVLLEKDTVSNFSPKDPILLDRQVEHGVPHDTNNCFDEGTDCRTEIEKSDDKPTEFEVEEAPVRGHSSLCFPDTFVSPGIKIPFGSFGRHEEAPYRHPGDVNVVPEVTNRETEPTCGANSNKPEMILNDLQGDRSDANVTCEGVKYMNDLQSGRISMSSMESSASEVIDAQTEEAEVPPYNCFIKVPRFEHEKSREQIKNAQLQLEKTRCRDALMDEIQGLTARLKAHIEAFIADYLETVAARRLNRLKRQEIDSILCVISRVKAAIATKDNDSRIYNAEHMIKLGISNLKDEKFIHEIKQINSDQLASNMGSQDEIQQALDKKDQIVSQRVEVSVDKTETDIQLKGSAENIEVSPAAESLKSEHKNVEVFLEKDIVPHFNPSDSTLLDRQVEHGVSHVGKNSSAAGTDYRTEIEVPDVPDDKQTEFEVKEAPVRGHSSLSFPDTFVNPGIKIQFGSFGGHEEAPYRHPGDVNGMLEVSNRETEPACGANSNKPEMILNDLQGDRSDGNVTCHGVKYMDDLQSVGISVSSMESSASEVIDAQTEQAEVPPYNFMIRVPRFEDEKLREQIKNAQLQFDEKTRCRDAIRAEIQGKKARLQAHNEAFNAANLEMVAARRLVRLKRQEIDSINCVINRVKNAMAVKDIDSRIYNAEHMINHETLSLKDEKKFIHEIKQLKSIRDQVASNMGSQDEIQQALDQKDQQEECLKKLKRELNSLKDQVSKAEVAALAIAKIYEEENKNGKELQAQFRAADEVRQEAYGHLNSLKKHLYDKNKMFHMYKEDVIAARNLASCEDKAALHRLCANQVERFMEEWNTNGEFRKDYTSRCSMSASRRHSSLHEPLCVFPNDVSESVGTSLVPIPGETKSISVVSTVEQRKMVSSVEEKHSDTRPMQKVASVEDKHSDSRPMQKVASVEDKDSDSRPMQKVASVEEKHSDAPTMQKVASVEEKHSDTQTMQKVAGKNNKMQKTKELAKPTAGSNSTMAAGRNEITDHKEEEEATPTREALEFARKAEESRKEETASKLKEQRQLEEKKKATEAMERKRRNAEKAQTRAELEFARKAEESRKEETASKLKEQRRLEEKKKATEAMERKKRNAEKAQTRAELRAQKEAEQKVKAREKRLRKKEKKRAGGDASSSINGEDVTPPNEAKEIETTNENPHQHPPPHLLLKQVKPKCIPPPPAVALAIRNRRRWRWWKMATLATLILPLFLLNNTDFFMLLSSNRIS